MQPSFLFDKSFLQAINLDESVWFDHFFRSAICPVFYIETLADLALSDTSRPPDSIVKWLAEKSPELRGDPCAPHLEMATYNFLGFPVPMDGRLPKPGGRYVEHNGGVGVVYGESPEAVAFSRWQDEKFDELDRQYASEWRKQIEGIDLKRLVSEIKGMGIGRQSFGSIEEVRDVAVGATTGSLNRISQLTLASIVIDLPQYQAARVFARWESEGRPSLATFAPYTAFVVSVEVFFQLAMAADFISSDRASNRMDMAYLCYLPFVDMFVSGDKIHRNHAHLFMRPEQQFVWAPDLKAALAEINQHFLQFPENQRELGIMKFASRPPQLEGNLVARLWDKYSPGWRQLRPDPELRNSEGERNLVSELTAIGDAPSLKAIDPAKLSDPTMISVKRRIARRKGSWVQVPVGFQGIDDADRPTQSD